MPRAPSVVARAAHPAPTGKPKRDQTTRDAALPTVADLWARVLWLVTAVAWVFMAASLISFDPADAPSHVVWPTNETARNWCGTTGAIVSYHILRLIGGSVWILMVAVGVALALPLGGRRVGHLAVRLIGVIMSMISASAAAAIVAPRGGAMPDLVGGTLGVVISTELLSRFGVVGGMLWAALGVGIGAVVALDRWLVTIPRYLYDRSRPAASRLGRRAAEATVGGAGVAARGGWRAGLAILSRLGVWCRGLRRRPNFRPDDLTGERPGEHVPASRARSASRSGARAVTKIKPIDERAGGLGAVRAFDPDEDDTSPAAADDDAAADAGEGVGTAVVTATGRPADQPDEEDDDGDDLPGAPQVYDEAALREKIARLPVRFAASDRRAATEDDLRDVQNVAELEGYRFPGLDLLEEPEKNFSARLESLVREQAQALESALNQYRISGEVTDIESGPVITLYHVRMAPGTKVAQLSAVASDIARALKAVNIRIVPNIPGRDTVGVEVPNPTKERVRLKELMSNTDRFSQMKLPMFLGKDASGEPLIGDLTTMPHMLIAGTTGSGKSVCMNTIIMSFLYTRKPSELKLVLVDPKMVEMSQFKDIPHLMCPVVTEMAKAAAILEWAVRKMDERYELLAEAGCRDIAAYNEMTWDELRDAFKPATQREEALIPRKLPYMVFIIDELADLMMTNKEVEGSIIRIAQKARAVGIHLILATQRPQANVVTGLIKSNMPCRIAFKVASGMDSRIVLDQKGGELLLGQGDMLFLSPRTSKLSRAQGTLVDDKEIRRVVRFMRDVATPTFERQLVQLRSGDADEERIMESKNNSSASLAAAQEDPMFDRAVEIVLESKRGSVSLLQRRLAIGYTRASRLIDLMGIAGIIGEHKGSVAREVIITLDDWEAMKRLADEEARRLGISRTLFDGGGSPTDLGDIDSVGDAPSYAAAAQADLDMGGMRADGAGPIIGGRGPGESEEMDLSDEERDDPPDARSPLPEPPFEATGPIGADRPTNPGSANARAMPRAQPGARADQDVIDDTDLARSESESEEEDADAVETVAAQENAQDESEEESGAADDDDADEADDDEYEYEYEYVEVDEDEEETDESDKSEDDQEASGQADEDADEDGDEECEKADAEPPEVEVRRPKNGEPSDRSARRRRAG